MGSFYFLEEQALLRNITVTLLWVQYGAWRCISGACAKASSADLLLVRPRDAKGSKD